MIDEELRKVQLVQLEIALEVKRICEENNIKYFLDSGTLLGAVRHKGFIPWDDDLDIGMERKEYEKFLKIAPTCLSDKYQLQSWENDDYYGNPFVKVRKKNTKYVEMVSQHQKIQGIYVDIFPYDIYPEEKSKQKAQGPKIEILKRFLYAKSHYKNWVDSKTIKQKLIRRAIYLPFQVLSLFISRASLFKLYDKIATQYNGTESHLVFQQTGGTRYGKWVLPIECITELAPISFEGHDFLGAKDYDKYLKTIYGDYMKLPPEDKRYNRHGIIEIDFGEDE